MENIFEENNSKIVRKFLIDNIKFTDKNFTYKKSLYAVMNPTNFCPVGCPHCLYSSLKLRRPSEQITLGVMRKFIKIANQAKLEMLVFSGGGEPFENFSVIIEGIRRIKTLKDVVIITSGYFANDKKTTGDVLGKIYKAANFDRSKNGLNPVIITLRISRDNSQCKTVPLENILNILNYFKEKNDFSNFRVIIRTILDYGQDNDVDIAKNLNLKLLPKKDKSDIYKNMPTIDGLPTRWLVDENQKIEIPIIYKPLYFLGKASNAHSKNIHSLWSIVESEENSGTPLNLCIRGSKGEGHNYYESVFRGYEDWKKLSSAVVDTPKSIIEKQLALYVPASGNILINNGSPDIAPDLKGIKSWNQLLEIFYSDPVERLLVEKGPFFLKDLAKEVEADIDERIDKTNFVFSVSLLSLITPQLRLYITLRAIKKYLSDGKLEVKNGLVKSILESDFAELYKKYKVDNNSNHAKRYFDPITGDAENIASDRKISSKDCKKIKNLLLSLI